MPPRFTLLSIWTLLAELTTLAAAIRPLGSSFGIPGRNVTFDYIVVGGGNAGLTMATRLAEQQSGSVAVVEAGTFYELGNGNLSQVPGSDNIWISKAKDDWQPLIDWGYITSPQQYALNTELHYARGKTLGGCSARNYMIYQRPTVGSCQTWADAVGDDSYTFDNLLPYYQKSICFTPPSNLRFANSTPLYDDTVMGDCSGPLSVTYSDYAYSFASWATEGLQAMGMPPIQGFQSGALLGQSYVMSTIDAKTQTRDSSETSFLQRALSYPNYFVYTTTQAKRIIFGPDKKATGVEVDTLGNRYFLTATKEVIISAGAFASPQLLMVSGIGPAAALEELGIPVVADRPGVGQNMQDHLYFGPAYRVIGQTTSSLVASPEFAAEAALEFQEHASGILTNPSNDVLGWEKFPESIRSTFSADTLQALAEYPADWPEIEYLAIAGYLGYQNISGGSDPNDGYQYATMGVALAQPRSRGNITITSADNAVNPIVNPNYFSSQADVEVAVAGFKRAREFFNSTTIRPFRADDKEAFPGLEVSTDEEIEQIIKESFQTIFHAACTCAMGLPDNPMAVVDSAARVYGVSGLRVVDASSFPFVPAGHPMGTVYALAEKIASNITGSE
ncbi:GMC oxidoreductase [Xylariaceae sp. FL1651]|nr:GMC oxidoreductase [Xylariaceae sp. FL1651]